MEEKITAERQSWNTDAEAGLILSMGDDSEILKQQVISGRAELWHFDGETVDVYTIVRREGSELVVCCLEGHGAKAVVPMMQEAAKRAGCKTMRAHTKRLGLSRMFPDWQLKEYVFEKVL